MPSGGRCSASANSFAQIVDPNVGERDDAPEFVSTSRNSSRENRGHGQPVRRSAVRMVSQTRCGIPSIAGKAPAIVEAQFPRRTNRTLLHGEQDGQRKLSDSAALSRRQNEAARAPTG